LQIELIDHMGSDLSVVNAARGGFVKQSKWVETPNAPGSWWDYSVTRSLAEADKRLIHYLVEHGYWSPFSHVVVKFRVTAPIIINHQLWKSHIGAATQDDTCGWNEVSRHYVDTPPEFYIPEKWRKRAEDVKQGSSDEAVTILRQRMHGHQTVNDAYERLTNHATNLYKEMLDVGVCPEQARMVLPQSMMTEWIWTGSLAFWARLYKLRMSETAQEECKPIASAIGEHMTYLFPVSWKALTRDV
jgi:thymidylate synthase (FAD)